MNRAEMLSRTPQPAASFTGFQTERHSYDSATGVESHDPDHQWLRVFVPATHPDGPLVFDLRILPGDQVQWQGW
jgi:hypothetical protein